MTDTDEQVLERFRAKIAAGDTSGIRVSTRTAGGMPGEQHLDRSVEVDGEGHARAIAWATEGRVLAEASADIDDDTLVEVLRKLSLGAEGLVPRSRARFLPDSLVGSVVVEVEGESTELFYLPDEEDRVTQGKPIPPAAADALATLRRLGDRMLGPRGGES